MIILVVLGFIWKDWTELLSLFTSSYNEVKTQFDSFIHILQSDNARNIIPSLFNLVYLFMAFFIKLHVCILHKNGVGECKNHHHIETSCTLLVHVHAPLIFWDVALLTSCYMINWMPSTILNGHVSHTLLFPHEPLNPLPLCIFGYAYFVHLLSPTRDKLSPRFVKCVFLGCSQFLKGYKCFPPYLNHYFHSCDGIFFESSPFFASFSFSSSSAIDEVFLVPSFSSLVLLSLLHYFLVPSRPLLTY